MIAEQFENVKLCLLVMIGRLKTGKISEDIGLCSVHALRRMHCSGLPHRYRGDSKYIPFLLGSKPPQ